MPENRGAHPQPHHSPPPDLFRLPKFDYYLFQSQRPPDVMVDGVSSGPMVFIANYATALVRATTAAGTILVRASAWGLAPGHVTIQSIRPEEHNDHGTPHEPADVTP